MSDTKLCADHRDGIIGTECAVCDLSAEIARLTAEVERLQAVVDAAREAVEEWQEFNDIEAEMTVLFEKLRALDGEPYSIVIGPLDDGPVGVTCEIGYLDGDCPDCVDGVAPKGGMAGD